ILDIMMERIDSGYAVAEKLGKEIPILMFSSMLNSCDAMFDPEAVPYKDVISKPIAPATLLGKVHELIGE
ncbi:MAG: two-component system response regulator, partial [Candidatus Hydrogenedentes bacterium]|nr:two-component system response regulator [Candidatus Hydrogenedentota bacterium]